MEQVLQGFQVLGIDLFASGSNRVDHSDPVEQMGNEDWGIEIVVHGLETIGF